MLMVLDSIGCMRDWAAGGREGIHWWVPCTIEQANAEERSYFYEIIDSDFTNASGLLFFAWDCDARIYFYDVTVTPWKLVVADGLSTPSAELRTWGTPSEDLVMPCEEKGYEDALSVIENCAFYF